MELWLQEKVFCWDLLSYSHRITIIYHSSCHNRMNMMMNVLFHYLVWIKSVQGKCIILIFNNLDHKWFISRIDNGQFVLQERCILYAPYLLPWHIISSKGLNDLVSSLIRETCHSLVYAWKTFIFSIIELMHIIHLYQIYI